MLHWKDALAELDHRKPLPPLHPTEIWQPELSDDILASDASTLIGEKLSSTVPVDITKAGLLVWNDDLDAAHRLVQNLDDDLASYWHAIIHRREGDYSNSKYWFAKLSTHPVFDSLYNQASRLWPACQTWGHWSPSEFVDKVAEVVTSGEESHPDGERLRRIQVVEFSFLLRHVL